MCYILPVHGGKVSKFSCGKHESIFPCPIIIFFLFCLHNQILGTLLGSYWICPFADVCHTRCALSLQISKLGRTSVIKERLECDQQLRKVEELSNQTFLVEEFECERISNNIIHSMVVCALFFLFLCNSECFSFLSLSLSHNTCYI